MPVHCSDCDHRFLVDASTVVTGACPSCGGQRLERDQPSGTGSDFQAFDMVDPGLNEDMGGNPLGTGTIMGSDGERPIKDRDNSFVGSMRPDTFNQDPYMPWTHESTLEPKQAFLPLLMAGGAALLRAAAPSLMRGALRG